ncbi:MAG: uroporphyrinogen decarboxylase family protein [Candidatus Lokiarchaeota archaeon]
MNKDVMTSLERVKTAMSHKEPDRVPFVLPMNLHGSKLFNISIKKYYSKPDKVVEAQIYFKDKYNSDAVIGYLYTAQEMDAWDMDIIFFKDGPPNAGKPFITKYTDIEGLNPPDISESKILNDVLKIIDMYYKKIGDTTPIIGVATSPFSLPIMQMGFNKYIELIYEDRELFWELMKINEEFFIEWANLQLEKGATAIIYSDPMSSPTIIPRELFLETGYKVIEEIRNRVDGNLIFNTHSARVMGILEDIIELEFVGSAISKLDNLNEAKSICRNKMLIMGNLDGIEMCNWTPKTAERKVKKAISQAACGGGFILTDHHGEIPLQVPENVISSIAKAVKKWGKYPLNWLKDKS